MDFNVGVNFDFFYLLLQFLSEIEVQQVRYLVRYFDNILVWLSLIAYQAS